MQGADIILCLQSIYGRVNSIGKPGPEKSESFTEYWAATLRQ